LGKASVFQNATYGAKRPILLRNPVQGIERDDQIELVLVGQLPGVCNRKLKICMKCGVGRGKGNHVRGSIDANHRTLGNAGGNFSRCLSVPTTYIKDSFVALEVKQRKDLFCHSRLQGGDPSVFRCIPFRHTFAFSMGAKTKATFELFRPGLRMRWRKV
jgi:hypothetical protein